MGISIFDKLWTTNSEISEVSSCTQRLFATDYDKELTDVQNEYESYTSTFDKLNEEKEFINYRDRRTFCINK